MNSNPTRVSLVVLICMVFIVGCVPDARELDQRSLIMGIAIDEGENKLFSITIQLPLYGQEVGAASVGPYARDFETFTGEGDTLWDALSALEAKTPTVLFLGHLKAVLISEEIAKNHVRSIMDFLERETSIAKQIYLIVIEQVKAQEFIEIESPLVRLPSIYLNQFFSSEQKIAKTKDIKLFEFNRDSNMISGAATLPLASVEEENEFNIQGMAIFEDYKLKGKLHLHEVAMSVLLKDNYLDGMNDTVVVDYKGEELKVSLTRMEFKQKMDFKETNPVQIILDIKGKGEIIAISDVEANLTMDVLEEIKKEVSIEIERELMAVISKMKMMNVEPWLIGHRIWAENPNFFDSLNWENGGWENAEFHIDVDFRVKNSGQRGYLDKQKIGR